MSTSTELECYVLSDPLTMLSCLTQYPNGVVSMKQKHGFTTGMHLRCACGESFDIAVSAFKICSDSTIMVLFPTESQYAQAERYYATPACVGCSKPFL